MQRITNCLCDMSLCVLRVTYIQGEIGPCAVIGCHGELNWEGGGGGGGMSTLI